MKRVVRSLGLPVFVVIVSAIAGACSLVPIHGYFHQVTTIRGRVVGKSLGPLQFRWLRQSFRVRAANVSLYEYRWPAKIGELKRVARVKTDEYGNFDFGFTPKGHYVLDVEPASEGLFSGLFEVEVTDAVRATKSITIDVSPIHPDCTGGLELIETKS